ncbi:DUF4832 domain-containing protein [Tumebacillus sp. ITR2]|uniref:DUF4832 domain-containing protein n=1 Tax=Tumebacillus amylolyticus TaxID=2801339 RepID=A0ABS1JAZ3_9BACL|nr:DUF4832 domain-containing protein [Tumebacillus amylolyticus]MBL0387447.1 DUF4832 domain-containing protein [Tumebacillus amylolyticus]
MRKLILLIRLTLILLLATELIASKPLHHTELPTLLQVHPPESQSVLNNPYMGLAPSADHGPYEQPIRLVYGVVTWAELEPSKNHYNFEAMEKRLHFDEWQSRGVQVILRLVLDYSSSDQHKDIPDWLYNEIQGDGIWYDEDIGKGFSPNYSNPTLIENHRLLLKKLGERYDHDPRIAFLALGSIGHWGEWHTFQDDHLVIPFPKLAVSDLYVHHYLDAFPDKKLLMRRPHPVVSQYGMGLYNDMFGVARSTYDFKDWYEKGYTSSLAGTDIPPMPDFWKYGPSGGEFGNADTVLEQLKSDHMEAVLQQTRDTHVSWMGATTIAEQKFPAEEQANLDEFLKTMGYRFTIPDATYPEKIRQGGLLSLHMTIANHGVAPFYDPWPFELSLVDASGRVATQLNTQQDIRSWLPGEHSLQEFLPVPQNLPAGTYSLCVALLDPETKQPGIDFAMEGRRTDGRYELGKLEILQ